MKAAHTFLAAIFALICTAALAQYPAAGELRVILKGHDPVAYFTEGKPVKGSAQFTLDWDEGRYYFANARNRDVFAGDPDRYAPRFGGHCTGSMSRGVRNEGHPEAWVIVDGKLFVFGAPDSATAMKNKENAEKDLAAFRVKVVAAAKNWREGK